ncbi:ribosomal protein, small subunit [Scheffersomyces xylosifermentans]|uniref:ribosomal protein, small subunit n=1 Tax=Scheffersomyces xylosifermentans TaxID=1304137 RepID=UPI00315E02E8
MDFSEWFNKSFYGDVLLESTTSKLTTVNMSAPINKEKVEQEVEAIHKIRITLTSTKVKQLESVSANIIKNAVQNDIIKKGPVRMPTKVLKITTRKTPNGEGSKTWDAYEMRIHKRVIDLQAPAATVKKITQITIEPGVDVEVTIAA